MKHGQITSTDLKSIWRIIAAVALCQLVGGAVCLAFSPHHFWFMNFWLGGAVGTLPGFVLGVVWQVKSAPSSREWIAVACFLGLLAVALTGAAFGFVLPRMQREMANLKALNQLQDEQLKQITVFDEFGKKRIAGFTDPKILTTFATGIADAVGHSPNHPRYTASWYVVVDGTTRHEFELHLNPRFPQSVIGYFVKKSGNSTSYHGTFESKGLCPWVEKHLLQHDPNQ
ncbi:hypothetical protein [Gimesia panareensis]|uniref:hypothetical protein n=1 Tax=Gimesia panareensis TaxID=2527978 RepID=UPI00118B9B6F|nr:hypothetical protein [Gimesia panareensis]QDU48443.1 hypothetical protein Pan110_07570 [Gimesia panareensis]